MAMPSPRDIVVPYTLPLHEPTGRPLWYGLPVPWVARWTSEAPPRRPLIPAILDDQLWVSHDWPYDHPMGVRAGVMEQRDDQGLLWLREGSAYGTGSEDATIQDYTTAGKPEWAKVHALRQRRCMLERRCQVCARPFGDEVVTFLVTPKPSKERLVMDPPVCESCIPVAIRFCPHQRQYPPQIIRAANYKPSFVYADMPMPGGRRQDRVPLGADVLRISLTLQLGVTVSDYTVEPA